MIFTYADGIYDYERSEECGRREEGSDEKHKKCNSSKAQAMALALSLSLALSFSLHLKVSARAAWKDEGKTKAQHAEGFYGFI